MGEREMEVCEGHVRGWGGGDELCGGADREAEGGG
jgi:hypothetical protein